jgi:hypothetical protein
MDLRLAIIDHDLNNKPHFKLLEEIFFPILKEKGIIYFIADSLNSFERLYGDLGNFDGLLLHLGIYNQARYLREIPAGYPALKIGLASVGLDSSAESEKDKIPLFDFYTQPRQIADYFLKTKNINFNLGRKVMN